MDTVCTPLDCADTAALNGDPDASVGYLRMLDPVGRHHLVAIHPETGAVEGHTFPPMQWEAMRRWIAARNGRWNLYYSPNEPKADAPHNKLKKEHIGRIRAVGADIDPKGDAETFATERARITGLIEDLEARFNDEPTFVVDSGGGMQPVWCLAEKLDAAEHTAWAEGIGRALKEHFGGDSTQNIDRILRLPGTINLPDERKRARGREPTVATLRPHRGGRHRPDWLEQWAPPIAAPDKDDAAWKDIEVNMDAVREAVTYEDLPASLRQHFEALCDSEPSVRALWQGDRSARPGNDASGSGFAAALARCLRHTGQFTATEFGQLLHVWEHASDPEHINKRQIQRAWARLGKPAAAEEFEPVEVARDKLPDRLPTFTASDLAGRPVPSRPWHVRDWIPGRNVTQLSGDGAAGKSLLSLQLAVSTDQGVDWLGLPVEQGRVLYLSAEDEEDEVHRRLDGICRGLGIGLEQLKGIRVSPLADKDAVLAAPEGRSNIIKATRRWRQVEAEVTDWRPRLVIVDTSADTYAGDENVRTQVRQFVGMLRGLAMRNNLAVVLISHPSLTGINTGSGTSGSTGWNNSVRSRLYLSAIDPKDDVPNPDLRILATKKMNYGRRDQQLRLRWTPAGFVLADRNPGMQPLITAAAIEHADSVFLKLLDNYCAEGRNVGPSPGANYAPAVFSRDERADGVKKDGLEKAMNRLFASERIRVEEIGPPSKIRKRLVRTAVEGGAE